MSREDAGAFPSGWSRSGVGSRIPRFFARAPVIGAMMIAPTGTDPAGVQEVKRW